MSGAFSYQNRATATVTIGKVVGDCGTTKITMTVHSEHVFSVLLSCLLQRREADL